MPAPLPTRDEEAVDRARHRWFMIGAGLFFSSLGVAGVAAAAQLVAWGTGHGALGFSLFLVVSGLVVAWRGWTTDTRPDPGLPTFEQLPADDPRKARPLAARRRTWLLGFAMWLTGWGLAAAAYALTSGLPPLLRLVAVLLPSVGGVAIGARWMREKNGSDAFPVR